MPDPLRETLQASLGTAYTLSSELGGGGMSRVFVAREEALGRDVVVKVLSSEIAEGLSVERFGREIRLAAALQEPHIVPVLTAGVTALGMPYYTMPFVRGASLRDRLAQGPVPTDEALALLRDVAQALAYAHSHGVVHRDIKPENILLSSGTAVVTDFGIAKALQLSRTVDADGDASRGITRTGTSLGTPAYMAPEQAAGDPDTDQRADLYAWGVVAYELLTGRHPFAKRTSPQQLLRAHLTETPAAFPPTITVSPTIAALVLQCLAKDPDDRPASAGAVQQQLHDGQQRTDASPTRARAPRRVIAVATFVTLAVVATGTWWRGTTRDATTAPGAPAPVMMAVLPFEHAGPADQQPFTDGLTDAVTSKLASLSSLLVIDRRSAATYRGTAKPAQQIGKELGVRYLLEGVVRWAQDGAGAWRARVTPTLVDAKAGTIKWTGTPVDVTLDDPFTAQGSIATDVAQAMEVAVLPAERVQLRRRFTDNPQAFAAYQRADEIINAMERHSDGLNPEMNRRAIRELNAAIALDSNFGEAWGSLAKMHLLVAAGSDFADTSVVRQSRNIMRLAVRHAPLEPRVLITSARWATYVDQDRAAADSFIAKALSGSPNDARILSIASNVLSIWDPERARKLAVQAAQLDPRSVLSVSIAADASLATKRWSDARRFGEAAVALDSAHESGWIALVTLAMYLGDSVALQQLGAGVARNVRTPSSSLACNLAYGSRQLSAWYVKLSAAEQRVATLADSVWYYDCKTDASWRLHGRDAARLYSDSIIALLTPRRVARIPVEPSGDLHLMLAFAYANIGEKSSARSAMARVIGNAPSGMAEDSIGSRYSAHRIGTIYATIGDTVSAMRWLRVGLRHQSTVPFYRLDPRLQSLRGTETFARFVLENDH